MSASETKIRLIALFPSRRVGTWSPEQGLIEGPSPNLYTNFNEIKFEGACFLDGTHHHNSDIGVLGRLHSLGETGLVVRPELCALSKVNLSRAGDACQVLTESIERSDGVVGGIEKDVITELKIESVTIQFRRNKFNPYRYSVRLRADQRDGSCVLTEGQEIILVL